MGWKIRLKFFFHNEVIMKMPSDEKKKVKQFHKRLLFQDERNAIHVEELNHDIVFH